MTTLRGLFNGCTELKDISGLRFLDTSKVDNLQSTFAETKITSVKSLSNWDTSKVAWLYFTFLNCKSLISLEGLENWDMSKVTTM